jgi:hypothetical protein
VLRPSLDRIPVTAASGLIEMAGPERVQSLLRGANVRILRYKHTIVELQLLDYGRTESRIPSRWGNPQKLSTNLATAENPLRVWKFKRLPLRVPVTGETS